MKKDVYIKLDDEKLKRMKYSPVFVKEYILYLEDNNIPIRTQIAYLIDINLFIEFLCSYKPEFTALSPSDLSLDDFRSVNSSDIREFLSYLNKYEKTFIKKNGEETTQMFSNGPKGKSRKISSLRTLYDYLIKYKNFTEDVTRLFNIKIDEENNVINRLEADEMINFLATIIDDKNIESTRAMIFHKRVKFRDYCMVLIAGNTGIRISELVQLDIQDVNLDKKHLIVTRKGGKLEPVYLPKIIIEDLREYMNQRKQIAEIDPEFKDALFLSLQKKRIQPQSVRRRLKKYGYRSDIELNLSPHIFRKSFAVAMFKRTGNLELVRSYLGHSTIETTKNFYARADDEIKKKEIENVDLWNTQETEINDIKKSLEQLANSLNIDINTLLQRMPFPQ